MANFTKSNADITSYFNPISSSYVNAISNNSTGFQINLRDISSSYLGLGSSSNIPISQLFITNFTKNSVDISTLYELYLANYVGTINTDYKIWDPTNHDGLLIQFKKSTTISFRYKVSLQFVMIGGGGGGGQTSVNQAGGGGGAGELITGNMTNILANTTITFTIGNGGVSDTAGSPSSILCNGNTITANGGGEGGKGSTASSAQTGSSTGGSGSAAITTQAGVASDKTFTDVGYFNTMVSYNNAGGAGEDQNNGSGSGGGGGGAGGVGGAGGTGGPSNAGGGNGGIGQTTIFGSTTFLIGGGGGGGARQPAYTTDTIGGTNSYGGGTGGFSGTPSTNGQNGIANTGAGGGGGGNHAPNGISNGGTGGSGTIIIYIIPAGVTA